MQRPRSLIVMTVLAAALLPVAAARAVHFDITLTVEAGDRSQDAPTDPVDKPNSIKTTPTFEAPRDQMLTVQFIVQNVYPHGVRKNVQVHYVVVRIGDVGSKVSMPTTDDETKVDPKSPDTVLDGRFTMNFKPKGRMGLRQQLAIAKAGIYLVRVESVKSQSDHEHFSQLKLVIK